MTASSPPAERLAAQIDAVRELALCKHPQPARRMAGGLFLDHAGLLLHDSALLLAYTEALLLLEMMPLLSRVLEAMFGVALTAEPVRGSAGRRWSLSLRNGVAMLVPAPGPWLSRPEREREAACQAARLLEAAAQEPAPFVPLPEAAADVLVAAG